MFTRCIGRFFHQLKFTRLGFFFFFFFFLHETTLAVQRNETSSSSKSRMNEVSGQIFQPVENSSGTVWPRSSAGITLLY